MGLEDRDYIRRRSPERGRLSRRAGMISFNTWLITLNVAVYIVANILLGGVPPRKTSWGEFRVGNPTPAQLAAAHTDTSTALPFPKIPGVFYHPTYAPVLDEQGRPAMALHNGEPVQLTRVIGGTRFSYRPVLDSFGHFSTGRIFSAFPEVWRFITFQFLHANATHLIFNMIGLWFVGGLVEEYLGFKRYAAFYLACGICGALAYLVLNFLGYLVITHINPNFENRLPALLFDDIYTPLVGASAGVFGVLLAAAYIAPNAMIDVLFVLPMRLRTAVYIYLVLVLMNLLGPSMWDLLGVPWLSKWFGGHNAGGDAAHVGGALAGAYLIRHSHLLRDFFGLIGSSRRLKGGSRVRPSRLDGSWRGV